MYAFPEADITIQSQAHIIAATAFSAARFERFYFFASLLAPIALTQGPPTADFTHGDDSRFVSVTVEVR